MKTERLNGEQTRILDEIQKEVPYYMEYMRDAVAGALLGQSSLKDLADMGVDVYEQVVTLDSVSKDEEFARGDFGRPGIMDGGPDEKQFFYPEAKKCRDILQGYGFPKISDL